MLSLSATRRREAQRDQCLQELVNFAKPELPNDIEDALRRASNETLALPESKPNPSLPDHMKPRPNQLKSKHGRTKLALAHR